MGSSEPFIILAGGEGRRLKSVIPDRPKPLAPVNGKPFLQHLIENLYRQGVRDVVLSLCNQADMIEAFVQEYVKPADLRVRTVREPAPMGTGGAVRFVVRTLGITTPFYVGNGDTYLPKGYSDFRSRQKGFDAHDLIGLVQVPDISRYGGVKFAPSHKILSFVEKSSGGGAGWINSGLYYLNPQSVDLPEREYSMERDVFPQLLRQGRLYGLCLQTDFIDIGIPSDYRRFESFLAEHMGNGSCPN